MFLQEGFLLGEVFEKETKTITDNEQEMVKLERTIKMNCAVPCPHTCYFYDSVGKVNIENVQSLLGDKAADVIAWYKFRHSPGFKLTLREKIIHKQLADIFKTPCDLFTTCLLTKEVSDNHSTHLFSQTFVRYSDTIYQPLPMHIINLSDPNNSYRKPQPVSRTFKNLLESAKIDLNKSQSLKIIGDLHNALQKEIEGVLAEFDESESIFELEEEIKHLKKALNEKTATKTNMTVLDKVAEKTVENNNVNNGCGDALSDNINEVMETSPPVGRKAKGKTRAVKERNLKSEEQCAIMTRSQTANKVCSNISFSQAAQGRK